MSPTALAFCVITSSQHTVRPGVEHKEEKLLEAFLGMPCSMSCWEAHTMCPAPRCFISVTTLENLDFSENRIGPAFPPHLVHCTSLKTLDLMHNKLTEIPCALGMHPNLQLLDVRAPAQPLTFAQKHAPLDDENNAPLHDQSNATLRDQNNATPTTKTCPLDPTCAFETTPLALPAPVMRIALKRPSQVAYNNLRLIPDELVRAGCVPILRELVDQAMNQSCRMGEHNRELQPITGVRPDQTVHPGEKNFCYPLDDLEITVNARWNQDTDWLAGLLQRHTTLRALNGLHEWMRPPLSEQASWDLDGRLQNPLYECVFVRNCMMRSPHIVSINISNNDLRGRTATSLAQAIESSRSITTIDVNNCRWDEGIQEFGIAVRACGTIERLNLLALGETEVEWDLRGRLNSVIDVAFVASRFVAAPLTPRASFLRTRLVAGTVPTAAPAPL